MTNPHICDGCGEKPPVCRTRVGMSAFFVDDNGKPYHNRDAETFLCDDCCGHSGEEGPCYRIDDGVPMDEVE